MASDQSQAALTRDELTLAAIACDLYADEFPESIDDENPEWAATRLRAASEKLVALKESLDD